MSLKSKVDGIKQIWQFDNRWHLLLTRAFFSDESLNIYKYKNLEFVTDHVNGEANGAREILTSQMYKQFLPHLKFEKPINVLDIGANNGGFPLLLKSENFKLKKLACVELNPKTFSRMKFNIERNIDCDFRPVNAAVCGSDSTLELALGDGGTSENIYGENAGNGDQKLKIEGKTFDTLYAEIFGDEAVDICKLDIEGAEFDVFRSNEYQKIKNCKFLLMEIHHENFRQRSEIINLLEKINFIELNDKNISDSDEDHYVHIFANRRFSEA